MTTLVPSAPGRMPLDLQATLDLLAQTIVNALGFDVAVINLVRAGETLEVVSCVGPPEVRDQLLGHIESKENWHQILEGSQPWGRLRFLDHTKVDFDAAEMLSWVPDMVVLDEPEAWHPKDALFAPLHASDGSMLGILSVDIPRDGRRPDPLTRDALEAFAVSAALAIEHATLHSRTEESERLFRGVFNASPLGMALLDEDQRMRVVNAAMCSILGRPAAELTGNTLDPFTHPDDLQFETVPGRELAGGRSLRVEQRYLRPDGSVVWGELTATQIGDGERAVLQLRDVTEHREAVGRLRHLASHDTVTGVGNRSLLMERLSCAVQRREEHREPLALLFVDLDGFKRVNDAHSHAVGDQVLYTVARRLCQVTRAQDTVARWGGDEFIVLVDRVPDAATAVAFAERVERAVSLPIHLDGDEFRVTASVGITFSGAGDTTSAGELLHNADSAMYQSKRHGEGGVSLFEESLRRSADRRAHIEEVLRTALDRDRLVVHYQPIIALQDGSVTAVEALLRLRDDDSTLLYPDEFLAAAEELGLLVAIEYAVLREACQQAKTWESAGHKILLSVNVCVRQLVEIDAFEVALHRILDDSSLPAERLTCEITEHAYLDANSATLTGMRRLTDAGINFSVDDFGTGFGSMTYLRSMPIQEIKIDRSFVAHAPIERAAAAILRAHAILASELGVRCVAEGVETPEQHTMASAVGVGFAQGYLYQEPVPGDALLRHLERLDGQSGLLSKVE